MENIQIKKENVKKKILEAAKNEFLLYGYEKSSLREIAIKAGVTKGNIYIYFKNKNDLFSTLVKPAMDVFLNHFDYNEKNKSTKNKFSEFYSIEFSISDFYKHVKMINEMRDEMKLLFFCSDGSSYFDFKERVAKKYEEDSIVFYNLVEEYNIGFKNNVSHLFLHTCALLYISFIEEILINNPGEEELNKYIREMAKFVNSGIMGIINR